MPLIIETQVGGKPLEILGWIKLPSEQLLCDAVATVGLDDVSNIDAPSVRVAETTIDHLFGRRDRISFRLKFETAPRAGASYVLTADIRRTRKSVLSCGDFLTTKALPWDPTNRREIEVGVSKI